MADTTDEEALVETVARAFWEYGGFSKTPWENVRETAKRPLRQRICAALAVAVPVVKAEYRELLEDVALQFAYRAGGKQKSLRCLTTGGLSTLEAVFAALGWDDPHYVTEGYCEQPGCMEWATCGANTNDGYKRLCGEHFLAAIREQEGEG